MNCRICWNSENNKIYEVREMMFGFRDKFKYFQCANCDCLQILEIPGDLSKYYPSNYYSYSHREPFVKKSNNIIEKSIRDLRDNYILSKSGMVGKMIHSIFPNEYLSSIIDFYFPFQGKRILLNKKIKILDVGCGNGDLLWILRESGFKNLLGVDPYIEKDIAYLNGLKILKKNIHELDEKFDLIMLHHSFEHMSNPLETLQSVSGLLCENGTCLIRIPIVNSYAWEHYRENWVALDAPRHFFLHSVKSIKILAAKANLQLRDIVYDSTEFNIWGSEQYVKDVPLESELSLRRGKEKSIFSDEDITSFRQKVIVLNKEGRGDQAAFCLIKQ